MAVALVQPTAPDSEIYDIWLPLNWMSFFSVTARFFVALCFKDTNCEMSSLGIFIHKCKFPRQKCTDMQLNNNSNRQSKNLTYVFIYKPSFQKIRSNYVGRFDTHKYCYQTNSKKSSSHESARKESFLFRDTLLLPICFVLPNKYIRTLYLNVSAW